MKSGAGVIKNTGNLFKGLWATMGAHPILTTIAAIAAVIKIADKLTTSAEEAFQQAQERTQKAMDVTQGLTEEQNEIGELIERYKELKSSETIDANTREEIIGIQKELNQLVGDEIDSLDMVNGKLDEQYNKLKQIEGFNAQENMSEYISAYSAASKSVEASYISDFGGHGVQFRTRQGIGAIGDLLVNLPTFGNTGDVFFPKEPDILLDWDKEIYDAIKNNNSIEVEEVSLINDMLSIRFLNDRELNAQDYYDILGEIIKDMEKANLSDKNAYIKFVELQGKQKTLLDTREKAAYVLLDQKLLTKSQELMNSTDAISVDDVSSYVQYANKLLDLLRNDSNLSHVFEDNAIKSDELKDYVLAYMSKMYPKYGEEYYKYRKRNATESDIISRIADKKEPKDKLEDSLSLEGFSDEDLDIISELLDEINWNEITDFHDLQKVVNDEKEKIKRETDYDYNISQYQKHLSENNIEQASKDINKAYDILSKNHKDSLSSLWDSESFADIKSSLKDISESADGITPEHIIKYASECEELDAILKQDGMSAKFLANIFQTEFTTGDGLELINSDLLRLNDALLGASGRFQEVSEAKAKYDLAMSVGEKDDNFKSYSEAFSKLKAEFDEGTVNSNGFWAASEFIFGKEQLEAWEYNIDTIYSKMQEMSAIFEDPESAGIGFLERLNSIATDGTITDDEGNFIAQIEKLSDGSYDFDIDSSKLEELAQIMGLSEESILSCVQALAMFGDVDYHNIDEVLASLGDIGLSTIIGDETVLNLSLFESYLGKLGWNSKEIYGLKENLIELGNITFLDTNQEVEGLLTQLEELKIASQSDDGWVINFEGLTSTMKDLGYTKEQVKDILSGIEGFGGKFQDSAGNVLSLDEALEKLDTINFDGTNSELQSMKNNVDNIASAAENATMKVKNINTAIDNLPTSRDIDINVNVNENKTPTTTDFWGSIFPFRSYANGTRNAPNGEALVGEEGEELIKSGDTAYLAGRNGAEIVNLNSGDIVYTAEETRKIKRNGTRFSGNIPAYSEGLNNGMISGNINSNYKVSTPSQNNNASNSHTSSSQKSDAATSFQFEEAYKYHQHLVKMEQETDEEYLNWLTNAYQEAYESGQIKLDDFYKYQEEVYEKSKALFEDYINDTKHQIELINNQNIKTGFINKSDLDQILSYYTTIQEDVSAQADKYRKQGLDGNYSYIQELQNIWWECERNILESITNAYDSMVDSIENSIELEKEHLNNSITTLDENSNKEFSDSIETKYNSIQELLHEEAEALRSLGYSDESPEIQDIQKQWWDAESNKNDSLREIFDRRLELSEDYIERSKVLGWENGDNEIKARERILEWMQTDYYKSLFDSEEEWQEVYLENYEKYRETVLTSIDRIYDSYSDSMNKINNSIDNQIKKEEALLDVISKQFDVTNKLNEARHDADKAIADSRISKDYLSDREYALIYNEEDYAKITSVIDDIDSDITRLTKDFNEQIENAYINGQEYLIDNITSEYERQVELKMQELSIAQAELDIVKKQTELNNVLEERNVRQITEKNGKFQWEWVANIDKVREATEGLSDAQYQHQKAQDEKKQQDIKNTMQENIDDWNDEQSRNNKLVEELGETIDNIKNTIKNIETPIEGLTIDVKTLKEQGVVEFSKAIDTMVAKLGGTAINPQKSLKSSSSNSNSLYDPNTDYMAKAMEAIEKGDDTSAATFLAKRNVKIGMEGLDIKRETLADVKKKMGYATGTLSASKGIYPVNEKGEETYINNDGVFHNFTGGEVVFNAEQTKVLYDLANQSRLNYLNKRTPNSTKNLSGRNNLLQTMCNYYNSNKSSYGDINIEINNPANFDDFTRQLINTIRKKTI